MRDPAVPFFPRNQSNNKMLHCTPFLTSRDRFPVFLGITVRALLQDQRTTIKSSDLSSPSRNIINATFVSCLIIRYLTSRSSNIDRSAHVHPVLLLLKFGGILHLDYSTASHETAHPTNRSKKLVYSGLTCRPVTLWILTILHWSSRIQHS